MITQTDDDINNELLYELLEPYICGVCGEPELAFITCDNSYIKYRDLIKRGLTSDELISILNEAKANYIKCMNCDRIVLIDYSNSWPIQTLDPKIYDKYTLRHM